MAKKQSKESPLSRALAAKRESKHVEFKQTFDPASRGDWCEIVKDVVALANSGGGHIVFGLDSQGKPTKVELGALAGIDPAQIVDKISKYVDVQFSDVEVLVEKKSGVAVIVWRVPSTDVPVVFTTPGIYETAEKKPTTAFSRGTLYFRHGAKSEPAKQQDVRESFERRLEKLRRDWAKGLRKVVDAPEGYNVHVLPPDVTITDTPGATAIRLTNDPAAPAFFKLDPNTSYPFRQKELVVEINRRLPKGLQINQHDVLCVRRQHDIDSNETFTYHPKFGSPQYSPALIDWVARQYDGDPHFFESARVNYYEMTHKSQ